MSLPDGFVKLQQGNYNLRTKVWCPGVSHPNSGDRSIDCSWVFFLVQAETQEDALEQVKRYCASKKARFTGMYVELRDGEARLSNGNVIPAYEIGL